MKKKYTVLLLYPDYLASNYGEETYLAWVRANTVKSAILDAQHQAALDNELHDEYDPEDFRVLFVGKGHQTDLQCGD